MADETTPVDHFGEVTSRLGAVRTGRTGVGQARDAVAQAQQQLQDAQTAEADNVDTLDEAQKQFDIAVTALRATAPPGSYWALQSEPA